MRVQGLEPWTYGLKESQLNNITISGTTSYKYYCNQLRANHQINYDRIYNDLTKIINLWPSLPPNIKTQIILLIEAVKDEQIFTTAAITIASDTLIIIELKKYLNGSKSDQQKLFNDNFNYKRWKKICRKANLYDLKFHDLRKTFGSVLAQNGISTAVTQRLLEHSSPNLTNKVYTNVDPVLRHAVERLPIDYWLKTQK